MLWKSRTNHENYHSRIACWVCFVSYFFPICFLFLINFHNYSTKFQKTKKKKHPHKFWRKNTQNLLSVFLMFSINFQKATEDGEEEAPMENGRIMEILKARVFLVLGFLCSTLSMQIYVKSYNALIMPSICKDLSHFGFRWGTDRIPVIWQQFSARDCSYQL